MCSQTETMHKSNTTWQKLYILWCLITRSTKWREGRGTYFEFWPIGGALIRRGRLFEDLRYAHAPGFHMFLDHGSFCISVSIFLICVVSVGTLLRGCFPSPVPPSLSSVFISVTGACFYPFWIGFLELGCWDLPAMGAVSI